MLRRICLGFIALLAIAVAGYAIYAYATQPLGNLVHPKMKEVYRLHYWAIYGHIFGSVLALLLGPLQFSHSLRVKFPKWHRLIGKIYLTMGVGLGGICGFYMGWLAHGGWLGRVGFLLIACAWLITGWLGYQSAVRRDFTQHRRWMIRNYAMTFAAVTLRVELGLFALSGMQFDTFYPITAWASWIPNVIIAELYLRATSKSQSE